MSNSKQKQLPPDGISIDQLIIGQPYTYLKGKDGKEPVIVLYQRVVKLPNDVIAHNFRLTGYSGFVNLKEEEVRQRIYPFNAEK